jgi:hypothetical protein
VAKAVPFALRNIQYYVGILCVSGQAQADMIINTMLNPSENLEKLIEVDSLLKGDREADWDENYRTSDEDGEKGTRFSFDVVHAPEGSERIGCICMDEISMDLKGTGACSGHGGVRFWIYELENGDEFLLQTERHKSHPSLLTEEELNNLSAFSKKEKYGDAYETSGNSGQSRLSWEELLAILAICVTIAFMVKTFWGGQNNRNDELYP